jgi:hypothetical protein
MEYCGGRFFATTTCKFPLYVSAVPVLVLQPQSLVVLLPAAACWLDSSIWLLTKCGEAYEQQGWIQQHAQRLN